MGKVVGKGGCDDAMAEEMLNCSSPDRIVQRFFGDKHKTWVAGKRTSHVRQRIMSRGRAVCRRFGMMNTPEFNGWRRKWCSWTRLAMRGWNGWPPASHMRFPDVEPRRCRRCIRWQRAGA